MITVEDIIADPPLVHRGGSCVFAIHPSVPRYLDRVLKPGMCTAETGMGLSTAVFAAKGVDHCCVAPDPQQADLFRAYCERKGIGLERVRFEVDFSENVLPHLDGPDLDLALIDGGHGFPTPFIDWFYLARRLKPGGHLLVDDVQIWTGRVLMDFLRREPGWTQAGPLLGRTAVFRMTAPFEFKQHVDQPYVMAQTRWSQLPFTLRDMVDGAGKATGLVLRGDLTGLRAGLRRFLAK